MRSLIRQDFTSQDIANAIQPVTRALSQQNPQRVSAPDIIGGIGWNIGLMGVWMILKARGKR